MIVEINDKEFCDRIRKSPRLNELYDHFERIANGSTQKYLTKFQKQIKHILEKIVIIYDTKKSSKKIYVLS